MSTVEHQTYANSSTGEDSLLCVEGSPSPNSGRFYFFSEG
jgi:hypothetical protein